jgi:hypothetical protein
MSKKPETDEELAAVRLDGVVVPHNATIDLSDYDPRGGEDPRGAWR